MRWREIIVGIFFILITALFFRPVFIRGAVPAPLNLLVSYYSPWRYDGYTAANKAMGFDNVRQMLPYKQFTKTSLMQGSVPLWNPNIFAGSPHIAMLQPAIYYPGTLLDIILPLDISWTILVILQPIIAGILTYIFLRGCNVSRMGSLIGGISFAFSGWMITWWEEFMIVTHSIIWLPLGLYGSLCIWEKKPRGFVWLTLALTLSIFASFTQSTLYLLITLLVWNIALWKNHTDMGTRYTIWHPVYTVLLSAVTAILITAIQWIPTLETYVLSPRGEINAAYIFTNHLLPLTQLVTLFAPDYWGNPGTYNAFGHPGFYHERIIYVGLVPLILSLVAFIHIKKKELTFWKYFTFITFSLVFALPTSWIWHTFQVPLLSAMQPTRIMMIATFGISVLSAYGFDAYIHTKNWRLVLIPIAIIGVIAMCGWGFVGWVFIQTHVCPRAIGSLCQTFTHEEFTELLNYVTVTLRNLILPSFTLLVLAAIFSLFHNKRSALFAGIVCVHIITMGYFANKYLYFSQRANMYPETPVLTALRKRIGNNRAWGYGNARFESNIFSYFAIPVPEGYAPFFPSEYGKLMGAIQQNGILPTQIDRSDVTLKHADEVEKMTDNPHRLRMMSLLGVKYVIETKNGEGKDRQKTDDRFPPSLFTRTWENENWRLWEYSTSLPRAFLVHDVLVATSSATYEKLFDPTFPLSKTIIVEKQPMISLTPNTPTASTTSATIESYEPNTVTIKTTHDENAMLFLSDSYYPGWNAYIDGVQTTIHRANYAFRAVEVPKGNHIIVFRYEPGSARLGLYITMGGIILCIFTTVYFLFRRGYNRAK